MGFLDGVRQGALDLFGFRDEMDELREANADARMIARKAEDLGHQLLNSSSGGYTEASAEDRRTLVTRAFRYYRQDPMIRAVVNHITNYVFGRGVPKPKYRATAQRAQGTMDAAQQQAQDFIDRFWFDEDNQRTLTTPTAQRQKSRELLLQGNVFLLMFRSDEKAPAPSPQPDYLGTAPPPAARRDQSEPKRGSATLKLTDLPEHEVVEIISHPHNRKIPVFYKREFYERAYDFRSGTYGPGNKRTLYYRDWRHEAPEGFGPPEGQIGEGVVYHIKDAPVSDAKFGEPDVAAILNWSDGLNRYMTDRLAVVQAIAKIALQVKMKGGPRQVSQIASQLADISNLAANVEGAATTRTAADGSRTKVALSNQGVQLEPMVQDTGSGSAMTDIQTIKGQIAAGSGIPIHYLGDVGSANLATATAMELPVLKQMEALQELWEGIFRDILGYMITGVGMDAELIEIDLPSILARDVNSTVASLASLMAAVDPQTQNRELIRFVVGEYLDAAGKANTEEILNKLFPANWEPPPSQLDQQMMLNQQNAELQQAAAEGTVATGAPQTVEGQRRTVAAQVGKARASNTTARASARNGTDRAPSDRMGTASSQRAAQARQDRAAGRVGQSQTLIRQSDYEDEAGERLWERDTLAELPDVLQVPALAALTSLDDLADNVMSMLFDGANDTATD